MMYKDGSVYFGTHFWWDDDENEYICCAKWKFEKGYDIPDSWHLQEIEVETFNGQPRVPEPRSAEQQMAGFVVKGYPIWNAIEKEGPPFEMKETDYE